MVQPSIHHRITLDSLELPPEHTSQYLTTLFKGIHEDADMIDALGQ